MTNVAELFRPLASETRHCEQHGDFTSGQFRLPGGDGRAMWSPCPHCERERIQAEDRAMVAQTLENHRRQQLERMMGRAAIPKRFERCDLGNYEGYDSGPARAGAKARRYADEFATNRERGTSLIFCGETGNGKTHLAVGIIKTIMAAGYSGAYTRVVELARAVKETYARGAARTERDVYEQFARPDLLVIDEVGRQRDTDTERLVLFEVINSRYEEGKPTLLSTNLSLQQLRDYLDEAAEDRLREGGGTVVVFDWPSYRSRA